MNFFKSLYKSCYDLIWLKSARSRGVGRAWGYFLIFLLLTTLAVAIPIALAIPFAAETLSTSLKTKVPEFSATVKSGELSITGFTQPFVYKTAEKDGASMGSFVVVVDTVSTSTQNLSSFLEDNQSGVMITKEKMEIYQANNGSSRIQYWSKAGDGTITKADVMDVISKITSKKAMVIFGLALFVFLYLGVVIGKLFSLMVISLVVYLIALLAKKKILYGDLFVIGLYAVTLPTLVTAVLRLAGVSFGNLYGLALLAFLLAIVFTKDGTENPVVPLTPPAEPPKPPSV